MFFCPVRTFFNLFFFIFFNRKNVIGQVGAIRHGISNALVGYDGKLGSVPKKAGFLTRDVPVKEKEKCCREQTTMGRGPCPNITRSVSLNR